MRSASIAANRLPRSSPSWPVSRSDVDDRRQRRDVPDHRHGAVLRVQRQRHLVRADQRVDRGALRGVDPVARDAGPLGRGDDGRVVRVEEDPPLRLVQVVVVRRGGGLQHPVGVVEHQADVAQPADAGLRADGRDADLDAREAERALLGLAGAVVEVDLLVRAAGHAHPPAAAAVLVDQDDAVLGALVDRPGRAGRGAGRVEAVLADARQVEHERLLELELHLVGDALASRTSLSPWSGAPPRSSSQFADQEIFMSLPVISDFGPGDRGVLLQRGVGQGLVVVGPRLVVVLDGRQLRVGEDGEQLAAAARRPSVSRPRRFSIQPPRHVLLVLVAARVALARAGSRRC